MAHGDFSWLARTVLEFRRGWLGNAMTYMMDYASGCSGPRLIQIQSEASQTILGDLMNFPFPEICDAWGNPDLGPGFRSPIMSEVPVFFLSGTLDARTPTSNAEGVAQEFPNSHHLLVEGAAHSFVECLGVPAIREKLTTFLMGGVVTPSAAWLPFQFAPSRGPTDD